MEEKRMREISDEELENVSGGGCSQYTSYVIDGKRYKVIPNNGDVNGCSSFVCRWCGGGKGKHLAGCELQYCGRSYKDANYCSRCEYFHGRYCEKFYKNA